MLKKDMVSYGCECMSFVGKCSDEGYNVLHQRVCEF